MKFFLLTLLAVCVACGQQNSQTQNTATPAAGTITSGTPGQAAFYSGPTTLSSHQVTTTDVSGLGSLATYNRSLFVATWSLGNAYSSADTVVYGALGVGSNLIAVANAAISANTAWAWGTSGATWSPVLPVGYTWRGAWISGTTYATFDVVNIGNILYSSNSSGNIGNSPPSSPIQWSANGLMFNNGPVPSVAWGNIVGTLSSQTDLASALSAKQNSLTFTGNGSRTVTSTGIITTGDCMKWDLNGNAVDAGTPCGGGSGGSGTVGSGNNGQYAYYSSTGTVVGGRNIAAGDITGLAASATTDTTNATNISSGTLNAARLPATAVVTGNATGTGSKYVSATGAGTSGYCAQWSSSGDLSFASGPCGMSSYSAVLQASSYTAHGDSITVGFRACGTNATTPQCAYDTLIAADARTTLNMEATSGYTSCDLNGLWTFKFDIPTSPVSLDYSPISTYLIGTNDADKHGTTSGYDTGVFQNCHKAMIAWNAISNKFIATDTGAATPGICTNTGSWTFQGGGGGSNWVMANDVATSAGATKSCPITTYGNPIYFWYFVQDGHTGTFTYAVDGGSATTLNVFSTPAIAAVVTYGWFPVRIPVSAGNHNVVITNGSGSQLNIMGIGTPAQHTFYNQPRVFVAGVPKAQFNSNSSEFSTYNAASLADVQQLAGDGMGVTFVDVRSILCTNLATVSGVANSCVNNQGVADMNTTAIDPPTGGTNPPGGNSLHPNTQGHIEIKQAFEAAMQFTPYVRPYNGTGANTLTTTGTSTTNNCAKWDANGNVIDSGSPCGGSSYTPPTGTIGQFTYYAANGTTLSAHTIVAGDLPHTGSAANLVTSSASTGSPITANNCAKWDGSGNVTDAGAACGTGSGNFTPSPAILANALVASNSGGTGYGFYTVAPVTNALKVTNGQLDVDTTVVCINAGTCSPTGQRNNSGTAAGSIPFRVVTSLPGTCTANQDVVALTTGTSGQKIYYCETTNTWVAQGGGSGTVNSATSGQIAYYASNGTTVSGVTQIADSNLPSDQCVVTKYTVPFSSFTSQATTTPLITLLTLASTSSRICLIEIDGQTSYAGTSITAATARLQSGAGSPMVYSPNQDIFGAVGSSTNNYWTDAGNAADRTSQVVSVALNLTGANATALTAGSMFVRVGVRTMP